MLVIPGTPSTVPLTARAPGKGVWNRLFSRHREMCSERNCKVPWLPNFVSTHTEDGGPSWEGGELTRTQVFGGSGRSSGVHCARSPGSGRGEMGWNRDFA